MNLDGECVKIDKVDSNLLLIESWKIKQEQYARGGFINNEFNL